MVSAAPSGERLIELDDYDKAQAKSASKVEEQKQPAQENKTMTMEVDISVENKDINKPRIAAQNKTLDHISELNENPYLHPKPFKIEARDIVLRNFLNEQENQLGRNFQTKNKDFVNAYLSTPQFINTLTDICDDVMKFQNPEDKMSFLKKRLCEINRKLPAQVYLPFVSKSMRNYAVLNIVVDEARIFQTKERAPILMCFEVYRPIEMTIDEPTELYNHENFELIAPEESNVFDFDLNVQKMKKKASQALSMLKQNDKSVKYRNEQLQNALMSPYTPNQRPFGRERSHSFKSNKINSSSVPHSSMGMSRGSYNARNKKNSKFNFFKQFKDKKEERKKGKRNKQTKDSLRV